MLRVGYSDQGQHATRNTQHLIKHFTNAKSINKDMKKLNPVMLAVLKGRLEQIADEMDATLFRSAFNPVIAEAHDACHGLYDAQTGDTLAQGKSGLPIFVGSNAFAVRAVIDKIAQTTPPDEGDVYIFNDPYAGGTHLNDFRLIRPYFVEGELFCFLASVGHWLDVGGNVPGNFNARAVESFQEGFMIPVVKLFRRGELQQDVVDIILANSRSPFSGYGDLYAQINALTLGQKRMDEMVAEYGGATLTAAFAQLKAHASEMMRKSIAALPDGVYRFEDYLDNDGIYDRPLKIALDLTIEGETMVLDFSRTDPPCAGPLNIARSTAVSCCYVALKHLFPDVPANNGVMEPITFVIPEQTLLNVSHPKAVGGYTETILRVIDVIFGAFAQIAPERANGAPYATINALSIAGYAADGRRWVMFSFFGGGLGGNPAGDGLNHGNNPISTATIPPVEIFEAANPIIFTQYALRPDSAGAGRHRGGLGAIYELELLADTAEVGLLGERGKFPPFGVNGGQPAAMNRFYYEQDDGEHSPALASKIVGVEIKKGQKVRIEAPGGGGFGDPLQRPLAQVAEDVRLGYVSVEQAYEAYGVVFKTAGEVDEWESAEERRRRGAETA